MEELIKELMDKAGLDHDQATKTVHTTIAFVKGKLPPFLGDKVEDLITGKFDLGSLFGGGGNSGGSPLDQLGQMFGNK
jgi:2'-5' RNA ligase